MQREMEEKIHLTKEEYIKLKKELDHLIKNRRLEIARRIGEGIYHKRIGDKIKVKTPQGEFKYEIMEIQ